MSLSNLATGLRPGVVTSTTRPTTPYTGQIIYETDTGYLRVWDGAAWDYLSQKQDDTVGLGPVGGLVFIKSQTIGSAVSSVEVTDAFSSTYDNYLIQVQGGASSSTAELNLRIGSVTSGYYSSFIYTSWNSTVAADGTKIGIRWQYVGSSNPSGLSASITVLSPNLAKHTRVFAAGGDGTSYAGHMVGLLPDTTQYTSFILLPAAGTITGGTITVYGYRKS